MVTTEFLDFPIIKTRIYFDSSKKKITKQIIESTQNTLLSNSKIKVGKKGLREK
jgi:hypothetical protein